MAIAVAMKAEKIIYLTAAAGLLEDVNDPSSLVPRPTSAELRDRIAHDSVSAGMIPKLDRKSVVSGKSVSVRVVLGGRRIIKKSTRQYSQVSHHIQLTDT